MVLYKVKTVSYNGIIRFNVYYFVRFSDSVTSFQRLFGVYWILRNNRPYRVLNSCNNVITGTKNALLTP